MHGLAVIHQRRHGLSMVIWRRDAFVTYLLHFRTWDVANPRTTMPFPNNLLSIFSICTVFAICQLISPSTGHGDGTFSIFLGSLHRPIPVRCNWSVFARKMHSTSEFAKIVLSKCVCVCNIWTDVKLLMEFYSICRGTQHFTGTVSNEATSEMGYPAWPAGRTCIFSLQFWLTWHAAKPRTAQLYFHFTVVAIWNYCWSFTIGSVASEPSSEQGRRKHTWNNLFTWSPTTSSPTVIYWLTFAETSPMILLLVHLFFLVSILNMKTIQKYFYYS